LARLTDLQGALDAVDLILEVVTPTEAEAQLAQRVRDRGSRAAAQVRDD
jgi:hypothetical protein